MDPNKALEDIRVYAEALLDGTNDCEEELASLILELDSWIKNGGFLPTDWSK